MVHSGTVAQAAEVIVVGAGPAGTAAAIGLAERGRDVLLLDRCRFPRDKPCGEFVNPAGAAILQELGVPALLPPGASRPLRGLLLRSADGEAVTLDYPGDPPPVALSVSRLELDAALVDRAVAAGARFLPGCQVDDLLWQDGRVVGVRCRLPDWGLRIADCGLGESPASMLQMPSEDFSSVPASVMASGMHLRGPQSAIRNPQSAIRELRAPLVIAADGAQSRLRRRAGLAIEDRDRRFALVAHFRGVSVELEQVEMHGVEWGYCGFALTGAGEATTAMVVRDSELTDLKGRPAEFFQERLRRFEQIHARLRGAERIGAPRVTGPVGVRAARPSQPGLLVVGDAAGFFDPFTGRGITRALRGGRLAAEAAMAILSDNRNWNHAHVCRRGLRQIDSAWLVERLIRFFVDRPAFLSRAVGRFQQAPELGRLLLGVAGDLLPASEVLNLRYAAAFLAGRTSSS